MVQSGGASSMRGVFYEKFGGLDVGRLAGMGMGVGFGAAAAPFSFAQRFRVPVGPCWRGVDGVPCASGDAWAAGVGACVDLGSRIDLCAY